VEVSEGDDLFVYKLDDFSYYVNENVDPSGIFYVEGKYIIFLCPRDKLLQKGVQLSASAI
jgi:hypothetical protein